MREHHNAAMRESSLHHTLCASFLHPLHHTHTSSQWRRRLVVQVRRKQEQSKSASDKEILLV
jgi:hypothetical protein